MTVQVSRSPEETELLGAEWAERLEPGDVVALTGGIGAGKTTFVRGLARGLGVPDGVVASPSFVLIREYHGGRLPIYHADLFRLESMPEAASVGIEEFYAAAGVTVIEWANRLPGVLPEEFLGIHFETPDPETRRISFLPQGSRYEKRFET